MSPDASGATATTAQILLDALTWEVAAVMALALALGALGGLAHQWTEPPAISGAPPRPPSWKQAAVGALAALAILSIARPENPLAFIAGSLVAGYAGRALLALLEARLLAGAAQRQAADARRQADEAREDFKALMAAVDVERAEGPRQTAVAAAGRRIDELRLKYRST